MRVRSNVQVLFAAAVLIGSLASTAAPSGPRCCRRPGGSRPRGRHGAGAGGRPAEPADGGDAGHPDARPGGDPGPAGPRGGSRSRGRGRAGPVALEGRSSSITTRPASATTRRPP